MTINEDLQLGNTPQSVSLEDNRVLSYPGDFTDEDIHFHLGVNEYGKTPQAALLSSMDGFEEKHPVLAKVADVLSSVMTLAEWEKFRDKELSGLKAFGATMLRAMAYSDDLNPEQKEALTRPEVGKEALQGAQYAGTQLSRGLQIAMPLIPLRNAIIARQQGKDAIQGAVQGFLKPEEQGRFMDLLPFQEIEQGAWWNLVPRAILSGLEDAIIYSTNPSQIAQSLKAKAFKADIQETYDMIMEGRTLASQYQISKSMDIFEEASQRGVEVLTKNGYTEQEAHRLMLDPRMQEFLRLASITKARTGHKLTYLYSGLPMVPPEFKPGDLVKVGEEIGNFVRMEGPKAVIALGGKEIIKELGALELYKEDKNLSLYEEAKKYNSAEEFVRAQFSKKPEYGMSHRPTYEDMPPAYNLLEGEAVPKDVYEHPEWSVATNGLDDLSTKQSWNAVKKLKGNPEAEVTIYRATRRKELNPGDWITFSRNYAIDSIEPNSGEKVYSFKIKAKDAIFAGDDINEFGYYPQSQLTDIWNKVNAEIQLSQSKVSMKPRGFTESVKEEFPLLKVQGQYIPRPTDKLAMKAANLVKDNIELAEKMATTGTDDNAVAVGVELLKHYVKTAEGAEPAVKNALLDKAAEVANIMAKNLTEQGRSIQAASILTYMTPEGQLRFAARTIQKYNESVKKNPGMFGLRKEIPELNSTQAQHITEEMKYIASMPDGEAKAIRFKNLQDYISELVPTPLYQKIVAVWKAGLLTGLKTTGLNLLANYSHAYGTEVLKDIPAVGVDMIASLFTGKRSVAFTTKGIGKGIKEGLDKGWRFLKTGYDERNALSKYDYHKVNFGEGPIAKALQVYTEKVFGAMGAEDQPFYYGAKARSIYEQAKVAAINEGLKGKEAKEFIDELVANPTDEMLVLAASDAEIAVFQNKTAIGAAAKKLQEAPAGEFILPFGKTPSAVVTQIGNYTPAGALKAVLENAGKGRWNQRKFSQEMGRALLGLPVILVGAWMFREGIIALNKPKSESEQKLWELEGRRPNSIKVGGKWRSVAVLGPAGIVLLMGAQFQNALNETGSITSMLILGSLRGLKSFTEQTFLTGVNQFVEGLMEPERQGERAASGFISSWIPTIVGDISRSTDPIERRVEGIGQALINKIPFLRQSLEPKVDVMGRAIPRRENFLEMMADPMRPTTVTDDPIAQEFRRLGDVGFPITATQLGNRKGYKTLTGEQNTQMWEMAGNISYAKIVNLMGSPQYDRIPDDIKAKLINEILDKANTTARAAAFAGLTIGLSRDEIMALKEQAKKDGLLSREVWKRYLEIR